MTLVELLVAFAVFLILVGMLVSLSTRGLETWEEGESRKDALDRGRRVLEQVSNDLRGLFADTQWFVAQGRPQAHAGLYCDEDKRGRQRLRFVCTGDEYRMRNDPAMKILRQRGQGVYTDLWEIAYLLDPDDHPPGLYRGVRYFNRATVDASLLESRTLERTEVPAWSQAFTLFDPGVLWIEFRFWTQYTTTWDTAHHLKMAPRLMKQVDTHRDREQDKVRVGPSLVWDSSRGRIPSFRLFFKQLPLDDPDFVYPEIVQVNVTVESQSADLRGAKIAQTVEEQDTEIRLHAARGLPEASPESPGYVRIGSEWVEYKDKSGSTLRHCRRGARKTLSARHEVNSEVRFGDTFVTDVPVPAYREAVR
jgi:hypothetical protein